MVGHCCPLCENTPSRRHGVAMDYQNLDVQTGQGVMTITINRPDKLNALNRQTLSELSRALDDAAADEQIRALIITGAGEKAFVAGADIGELRDLNPIQAREFSAFGQQVMSKLQNLGKPSIAAINGFALGGGCELALACTLRYAASHAKIGLPEIKLGIMPGFGGTQRLTRLIGPGRALEMALTGEPINAEQALKWGIVNKVIEPGDLLSEADAISRKLAVSAPHALSGILRSVHYGADLSLATALNIETSQFAICCGTDDMREGTSAFLERRAPVFKGA